MHHQGSAYDSSTCSKQPLWELNRQLTQAMCHRHCYHRMHFVRTVYCHIITLRLCTHSVSGSLGFYVVIAVQDCSRSCARWRYCSHRLHRGRLQPRCHPQRVHTWAGSYRSHVQGQVISLVWFCAWLCHDRCFIVYIRSVCDMAPV